MKQEVKDIIDEVAHDKLSDQVIMMLDSIGYGQCPACAKFMECEDIDSMIQLATRYSVMLN